MIFVLKIAAGGLVVGIIQMLSGTQNYYIAGLVPLFPTFALISHYVVGSEHTPDALKETTLFGMLSLLPYFVYLVALYLLIDRFRLETSLAGAATCWIVAAMGLILVWRVVSGS